MKFKEWLVSEVRYKGFKRQFVRSHPDMPSYVAKDLYNNRIGYSMRRILDDPQLAPTASWGNTSVPTSTPTVSNILNSQAFQNYKWTPHPVVIQVTPLDFDKTTQDMFLYRRFGYAPEERIRDDAKRMEKQLTLLGMKPLGTNEPIIVVANNDKYKLIEGWHRAMNYLVYPPNPNVGAPPEQIAVLKQNGDVRQLDFRQWKSVPILAYVGFPNQRP